MKLLALAALAAEAALVAEVLEEALALLVAAGQALPELKVEVVLVAVNNEAAGKLPERDKRRLILKPSPN